MWDLFKAPTTIPVLTYRSGPACQSIFNFDQVVIYIVSDDTDALLYPFLELTGKELKIWTVSKS